MYNLNIIFEDDKKLIVKKMVYCIKCGFKNSDDANFCVKCGVKIELYGEESWEERVEEWGEKFGRRVEKECFGLPHRGIIIGLFIGIFIILAGLSILIGVFIWRWISSLFIIMIGLLIIVAVLRILRR